MYHVNFTSLLSGSHRWSRPRAQRIGYTSHSSPDQSTPSVDRMQIGRLRWNSSHPEMVYKRIQNLNPVYTPDWINVLRTVFVVSFIITIWILRIEFSFKNTIILSFYRIPVSTTLLYSRSSLALILVVILNYWNRKCLFDFLFSSRINKILLFSFIRLNWSPLLKDVWVQKEWTACTGHDQRYQIAIYISVLPINEKKKYFGWCMRLVISIPIIARGVVFSFYYWIGKSLTNLWCRIRK